MEKRFSSRDRSRHKSALAEATDLDLLIIGGGITGAGILLDAVSRGLRAALVEMQDFAAGTSSRSTKLVHGGLRYLKQFEISLVREVGQERAVVYENAPHVTRPQWMLLPVIEGGTFGKFSTSIGLAVYDYLAKVKRTERRKMLSLRQTLEMEPLLRSDGLKGAGYYVEYRTDDARLTMEVIKKAVELGGCALNYVKAERLLYDDAGRIEGAEMQDMLSADTFVVRAKRVVNATGPWVDVLREQDGSKKGKVIHLTKGVHIVVDAERFPMRQSVYFDTPDGRMVFAIPRDGKTYIGTTDTNYTAGILHPRMTEADLHYLLDAVNFMFPTVKLTERDVESSWAGVRPLIHEEGKSPSEISRKDEIFHSHTGLITIAGGKLTGYRKMAERVVDVVVKELTDAYGMSFKVCQTRNLALSGGAYGGSDQFEATCQSHVQMGIELGLTPERSTQLATRYGTNVVNIYTRLRDDALPAFSSALPRDVEAELMYCVEEEACILPEDFFIRRTGAMFFDVGFVRQHQYEIVRVLQQLFAWDNDTAVKYTGELENRLQEATVAIAASDA
ncbi:glycerol-3-phosphate dehydrogenase/oxidase [Alicyclobacillus fodiniaquatilis]|uniref:Aerobic glycerol-3-phosphate dehydrogenase n=1 Tax=Alicyclobacillus fodiniaquatilis TaxID=1661150 RepID=A0ABW4JGQ6_9BACL